MQRILNTGKTLQQAHKRTVSQATRAFASSPQPNPFDKSIKTSLEHGGSKHNFYKLPALADPRIGKYTPLLFYLFANSVSLFSTASLPYSIRILLESAVRNCDDFSVKEQDIETILNWTESSQNDAEIPFRPARVILQDFTYVEINYNLVQLHSQLI